MPQEDGGKKGKQPKGKWIKSQMDRQKCGMKKRQPGKAAAKGNQIRKPNRWVSGEAR